MLFNSGSYLIFLAAAFGVYFSTAPRCRPIVLLLANAIFYAWWSPIYALALLGSTFVDYLCARRMEADSVSKRRWLWLGLALNLAPLLAFKYAGFLIESLSPLMPSLPFPPTPAALGWAAPVGISFFTFLKIGYLVDVYRGDLRAEKSFLRFAAFCSFFPLILSGPIERGNRLLAQLTDPRPFDYDRGVTALRMIAWGFFKKAVIADRIAPTINAIFQAPQDFSSFSLLAACYLFSVQIYCDFSGYTDIARGSAALLGYDVTPNFNRPYAAVSIRDFWRRWHISLSFWFRDYVYIPLGGNRCGPARQAMNIVIVFLASGLWHGAAWTFVVWGGLHGAALILSSMTSSLRERIAKLTGIASRPRLRRALQILITFHLVTAAWVFFKATSVSSAVYILTHLFGNLVPSWPAGLPITAAGALLTVAMIAVMEFVEFKGETGAAPSSVAPAWKSWTVISVLLLVVLLFGQFESQQFIYFQF